MYYDRRNTWKSFKNKISKWRQASDARRKASSLSKDQKLGRKLKQKENTILPRCSTLAAFLATFAIVVHRIDSRATYKHNWAATTTVSIFHNLEIEQQSIYRKNSTV
uniref:Uncharacterized protein n=1 Tax=Romanomermis culicivorax TaxID=13658 RepID=A0A915JH74_ROMCU